jgi:hypothetical protein
MQQFKKVETNLVNVTECFCIHPSSTPKLIWAWEDTPTLQKIECYIDAWEGFQDIPDWCPLYYKLNKTN